MTTVEKLDAAAARLAAARAELDAAMGVAEIAVRDAVESAEMTEAATARRVGLTRTTIRRILGKL